MTKAQKTIGFVGEETHYIDHAQPLIDACLEDDIGFQRILYAGDGQFAKVPDLVLVSSYASLVKARNMNLRGSKLVFMEHGSGQTYSGIPEYLANYYAGGERSGVSAILVPGQFAKNAYLNKAPANTQMLLCEIGCPKLANWKPKEQPEIRYGQQIKLRVGLSFHWDCQVCPETEATWHQWLPVIAKLKQLRPEYFFVGFSHPRANLYARYFDLGIARGYNSNPIEEHCDILLADNTSFGWEFLNFYKPVVWLNGIQYRKDINHGLRFPGYNIGLDQENGIMRSMVALDEAILQELDHSQPRNDFVLNDVYICRPEEQAAVNKEVAKFLRSLVD